jgi:hypothetical protein
MSSLFPTKEINKIGFDFKELWRKNRSALKLLKWSSIRLSEDDDTMSV